MQPMFRRQVAPEAPAVSVSEVPTAAPTGLAALPPAVAAAVWRGDALGQTVGTTWPSGFDVLDAALPGGGWPGGALTELLLPQAGTLEFRLLALGPQEHALCCLSVGSVSARKPTPPRPGVHDIVRTLTDAGPIDGLHTDTP